MVSVGKTYNPSLVLEIGVCNGLAIESLSIEPTQAPFSTIALSFPIRYSSRYERRE